MKREKLVLQNINSAVKPGSMTGIMGPSGSGKTSLLHVIAGMVPPSQISGEVLANGQAQQVPKRLVGFVFQDDLLLPRLTVGARPLNPLDVAENKICTQSGTIIR